MANSPEFKPCPFCGGEAVMCAPYVNEDILGYQVCCTNKKCGGTTRMFPTPEDAAAAWNRCAADTPSNAAARLEVLEFADSQLRAATEDNRYGDDVVYLVGCMRTVAAACRAALAKPPRNCDRFNGDYKMLHTAWFDWTGSPSGQNPDGTAKMAFGEWLLAPAKKGGAK